MASSTTVTRVLESRNGRDIGWHELPVPCLQLGQPSIVRCSRKTGRKIGKSGYRAYAVVEGSNRDPEVLGLARRLVSSGTADQVVLSPDWKRAVRVLHFWTGKRATTTDQLLVFLRSRPQGADAILNEIGKDVAAFVVNYASLTERPRLKRPRAIELRARYWRGDPEWLLGRVKKSR